VIDRPVRELMDPTAPTVAPDTTIKDLVHLLATKNLDGVAVIDGTHAVVGIVTAQDMLFQEVEADEHVPYVAPFLDWMIYVQSLGSWERHIEKAFAVTVSDLMTIDVKTASPDEELHEAAKRMAKDGVSQLPVVENGAYVGMLTRGHVVSALNRFEFGGGDA